MAIIGYVRYEDSECPGWALYDATGEFVSNHLVDPHPGADSGCTQDEVLQMVRAIEPRAQRLFDAEVIANGDDEDAAIAGEMRGYALLDDSAP